MKRISPAEWVRSNFTELKDLTDEDLNAAAESPPESVYTRIPEVRGIILHHSATDDGSARVFRSLHRAANGWVDVGYHYVIGNGTLSGDGEVEIGRPEWAVGAHTRGHNDASLGVCLVGDLTKHPPTVPQADALRLLVTELLERYGLKPADVKQHRDMPGCKTECPGMDLTPFWRIRILD